MGEMTLPADYLLATPLSEEVLHEVAQFLVTFSLYRTARIDTKGAGQAKYYKQVLPELITTYCRQCGHSTNWTRFSTRDEIELAFGAAKLGEIGTATYACSNCEAAKRKSVITFFFRGKRENPLSLSIQKIGQYPPQEIRPSKALETALGKQHTSFYVKGVTCRHHSFGIGALAYLRRIIEEKTDEMLDLLAQALRDCGAEEASVNRVLESKRERQFENKVRTAAEVLPPHLRPGGHNPFGMLYDLLSRGLHRGSDEECVDIADSLQRLLEVIFVELKTGAEQKKTFADDLKRIQMKLSGKVGPPSSGQ